MSIIERVVELLGSTPQTPQEPSARGGKPDSPDSVLTERTVGESNKGSGNSAVSNRAAQPDAVEFVGRPKTKAGPSLSTSTITPTVTLNPDRMRDQGLIAPNGARSPIAEAFRRIKRKILSNISNPKPGTQPRLVMVTSSVMGEGKSFCAMNLALSLSAERDHSVLLVDGDVARSSFPEKLGVKLERGWMDILLDNESKLKDVICKTNIERLELLPAGRSHRNVTELVASGAMNILLHELSAGDLSRIIIFDAPPLLNASESVALSSHVGQVVVVVEAEETTEITLQRALERIDTSKVAGLILNKAARPQILDEYGGEYGYDVV